MKQNIRKVWVLLCMTVVWMGVSAQGQWMWTNDLCGGAIALSDNIYYTENTATAADDVTPGRGTIAKGVWFTYTPSVAGMTTVDTCTSDFDTVLEVMSGLCGSLTSIANNDNGSCDIQSSLSFMCSTGVTYLICAGGYNGASGSLNIRVHNDGIVNLALASSGSTISGTADGVNLENLIDGVTTGYDGENGYGYTVWTPTPGVITLDLKELCTISSMKLLLWDLDDRYYRYKIEASSDHLTWDTIVDRTAETDQCRSWQDIGFNPPIEARYLRLMGTYNSANVQFHVVEWEIYGASLETMRNADRYVSLSGAHVYPFTNWMTAATNIQAAVDAAVEGDTVWVTNGVYNTGGAVAPSQGLWNRVLLTNSIAVRSVNGPQVTIIQGGGVSGSGAGRCAYLALNNCSLSGFTLTGGCAEAISYWRDACGGGAFVSGILSNCIVTGNSINPSELNGSALSEYGGGVYCIYGGRVINCLITGNRSIEYGGGVAHQFGDCLVENCTIVSNSASEGGGVSGGTFYNCTLTGNSATYYGGGASGGTFYNCTLTGNSADRFGGGAYNGTLYNCIVYYNDAAFGPNYYHNSIFNYSCTTPSPGGSGNITSEPQLASFSHLAVGSPCQGAGYGNYARGTDIDGEAWRIPPSMGCDEVVVGAMTGALSVSASAVPTNVAVGFPIRFRADILGRTTGSVWDFGDGTVVSNNPYALHSYASPGVYAVLLRAYNESYPQGITATVTVYAAAQAIHYVKLGNATPIAPYTSWIIAATNIQDALDTANQAGALVLVSNGIYATGGRVVYGALSNRVAITKPMTVRSVNGPAMTIIQGAGSVGDSAVRCAYVGTNAVLEGFTLTEGSTRSSGDGDREQSGGGVWCESSGVLSNCVFTGNWASYYGGGGCWGMFYNCTFSDNSSSYGGGTFYSTLYNCTLIGNLADYDGGGAYNGMLYNCILTGNSSSYGGGVCWGMLYNCTLFGNSSFFGGGAYDGIFYNCTLTGNSAYYDGGGTYNGTLYNCIVYYNEAGRGANYVDSTFNYSCTTPYPGGSGNITSEPQLASFSHLAGGSPCQAAGYSDYATGTDIDGEAWCTPPSMGCDEVVAGAITGTLSVSASAASTNVAVGFLIRFQADILGRAIGSVWDFGDGTVLSNNPYAVHAYASPGVYAVLLRAYNESYPEGIMATVTVHVAAQAIHYVKLGNATPIAPYTSWETAATTIQDALDVANQVGALVLVSNGVYTAGGRVVSGALSNRVVITNPVTVRSINGPANTIIQGAGPVGDRAVRCAYVGNNAALEGFTLVDGATRSSGYYDEKCGGGVLCESSGVLSNCVLTGNSASEDGGGTYYGTLYNCTLFDNSASGTGGGVFGGTLYNCTLTHNSAAEGGGTYNGTLYNCTLTGNLAYYDGGGVFGGTLYNCIAYYNESALGANYYGSTFNYSCTTPHPGGLGNITSEPQLASFSHLAVGSPCRGVGHANYATGTDIDGEVWRVPPSMGCDEVVIGAITGKLKVSALVSPTNMAVGFPVQFRADILGRTMTSVWDFGDGTVLSNKPYVMHAYASPGTYEVLLRAYNENESYPQGITATVTVHVAKQAIHYVNLNNTAPLAPYTSWATAATNIQDAIDAVNQAGALVLVSNGIYATGGRAVYGALSNRVAIVNPVTVRSVNGPAMTIIQGAGPVGDSAVRCAYVGNNAVLEGFTLTNGATRSNGYDYEACGGGVWCERSGALSNCVLTDNSASSYGGGVCWGTLYHCTLSNNSASGGGAASFGTLYQCTLSGNEASSYGGGVYGGTLYNCNLTRNLAPYGSGGGVYGGTLYNCTLDGNGAYAEGGGASFGTLYNCTLTGNRAQDGGGAYESTLYNCIVYYNTASRGFNCDGCTLNYSCTTPNPGGTNNIIDKPQFVDAAGGDYRLLPSSPCIDRGINQEWMSDAMDLEGNPRILNGTVDMGAYEFAFQGNFKVWLQGPYDTNTHEMTTALNAVGIIPLTSPYADDPRQVSAIPSNATDWVLLQLQSSTNSTPFVSKSVFLGQEGTLLSDSGAAELMLEASTGSYYVAIKHRNHLAVMSAEPVPFTNRFVSYDFTPGADQYYGNTNGAIQLESNVWGLIAGDADGDGEILGVDALLYDTQTKSNGYKRADFNLDGVVSNDDREVFWHSNVGRRTTVAQGETILKPALKIYPGRRTLPTASELTFSASGGTGTITWAFVKNPSGGTIPATYSTSMVYQAGITSSCIDVLETWDPEDRLGRAYINVIGAEEVARAGKAIIVAGRKSASDSLWPTTDYLADLAFDTLLYKGYSKANIQYLNPVTNQDVDGNSQMDDIDLETTWVNAALTFTNWATRTDRLFVYLVDHGGDSSGVGYFRLNESQILTATNLDAWLDNLQNTYTTKVTVLIDCCYAGSFLDELAYTGVASRIVIAACGTNEPTYFMAGGVVSFSDAFFGGVMRGDDVEQAWVAASNAMSGYQNACWNEPGRDAADLHLGASFVAGKDIPQIGSVMGNQLLSRTTAATLWAGDVVSMYPIERVWCMVVPPEHRPDPENPVADLSELDLTYDSSSGRYQARYEGFSEEGSYKVLFYAEDVWGSVSPPRQSYVTQSSYNERVILVAGGPTNLAHWAWIDSLARYAYRTFQVRGLNNERICYLNAVTNGDVDGDGTNDVDASISLANLANVMTNWARSADALTVYLLGDSTNQTLRLNETEVLDANSLNRWLNVFSISNKQAKINVIMDFSGSGCFLAGLAATNRICIASCRADQPAIWVADGLVSFSRYFLCRLFEGDNLDQAFSRAATAIRWATGRLSQEAQLDANGDGFHNKLDHANSSLSHRRYIGAAFVTGADAPTIGSVTPDTVLTGRSALWLWASDVTDREDVSNVWCVITPPDYTGVGDIVKTNLNWNPLRNRYEALLTNLNQVGSYTLTFQAEDTDGWLSAPVQSFLVVGPDRYEPDDTNEEATFCTFGQDQSHNLHVSNDEDWIYFYAVTGYVFQIEAEQTGSNVDLCLDVYYETNLPQVFHADNSGTGVGKSELVILDFKARSDLPSGGYYVRVRSADPTTWGLDSGYTLRVFVSEGTENIYFVIVGEGWIGGGLTNATIRLNDNEIVTPDHQGVWQGERADDVKVEVFAPNGYRPVTIKGGATNPCWLDSSHLSALYCFAPYVTVTGLIRDADVGAFVNGATLTFTAQSIHPGDIYTSYPNSSNAPQWATTAEGGFPSNVLLPPAQWQLAVEKSGYSNYQFDGINLPMPAPQFKSNLGTLFMHPVDSNGNKIADTWETTYFGTDSNVVAEEDRDGDGLCNGAEYVAGTDPTNSQSVLMLMCTNVPPAPGPEDILFNWPVVAGRTYRIQSKTNLFSEGWSNASDIQTAGVNEVSLQWTDTDTVHRLQMFYRLQLIPPVP